MRKTRIICTMGPAVSDLEKMKELLKAGMDGARFNFSHGSHAEHKERLDMLRQAIRETGRDVAMILDTKGPEIRVKTFEKGPVALTAGQTFVLCTEDVPGNEEQVSVTYEDLHRELQPGQAILLDDGLLELEAERIEGRRIICRVKTGGPLSNNKSINIPGAGIGLPSLTEKDREDLRFAVENDFDYVAASFIRCREDVAAVRSALDELGGKYIQIISKIENRQGVEDLDGIIDCSDGIMVARGDLGVEIPAAKVPGVQHRMIKKCRLAGKVVIVATQMLDSMIKNPRPTRAEVTDVAHAVFDMTGCVMLSGETASGAYPVESLLTMRRIVEEAESDIDYWQDFSARNAHIDYKTVNDAISHNCCTTAMDLKAPAIVTATQSGFTARMISRFRPACDIVAVTPIPRVYRQLWLVWGVRPCLCRKTANTDELLAQCLEMARETGSAGSGDAVVTVAGSPMGVPGTTNLIKAAVLE